MAGQPAHALVAGDGDQGDGDQGGGGGALVPRGACVIPGRLLDLGDWPGLIDGPGRVAGELYAIADPAVLPRLDAFEEYDPADPEGSLYVRETVRLIDPPCDAHVYRYAGARDGCALVPGGDWRAWKEERAA